MRLLHCAAGWMVGIAATLAAATAVRSQVPPSASAPQRGPEVMVTENVIVVPDANARSITGWLIVKAGCADEAGGNCVGIAHYLEHLLFINRDSDNRSKVAFFPDGSGNGWTSHRATTYLQRFPASPQTNAERIDKLMAYFAGLLAEVKVEPAQAERERNVVLQEYQQNTGRNPYARFAVRLNLALMPNEALGQRVIGSPETIAQFTPEAAREFHRRWYSRDNAIIVLHGPLDPAMVKAAAAKHLAALSARKVPQNLWKTPRAYRAERVVIRGQDKDARQIAVSLDKIVGYAPRSFPPGEMRAALGILSAYLSSRLKESPLENLMERDGLVTQARLGVSQVREGALRVSFSGVPADGVAPDRVIEAARAYIAALARRGLDEATVDRLKLRSANDRNLLAQQPGLYAQALVGWLGAHHSLQSWRQRGREYALVSATDVNRLIRLVAQPGREVVGVLEPEGGRATDTTARRDGPPLDTNQTGMQPQVQP
jgi:zinc protease